MTTEAANKVRSPAEIARSRRSAEDSAVLTLRGWTAAATPRPRTTAELSGKYLPGLIANSPLTHSSHTATAFGLTKREREVLELLPTGNTNATIGRTLFISAKTVAIHVSAVLRKLQADNRTHAVVIAIQAGLFE